MNWIKNHKYIIIVVLIFGVIYSLISLVNHYNFRTYALDLGVYTNALYDYIHFQWNDSTVYSIAPNNFLGDHFDLVLIIFSPFSLIFGTYTLLILQIIFVLLGGLGVYSFFKLSENTSDLAIKATIYFYLFFGVFAAISYDYHTNVIAACILPWFFYYVKRKTFIKATIVLLAMLIAKENISLWMFFVGVGLLINFRKDRDIRKYLAFTITICLIYFILVISFIIPGISAQNSYSHFRYSILGNNYTDAFIFLIKHPIYSFKILFYNHLNLPIANFIKIELHLLLILSGLPVLLKKPQFLLMLIPIYFQKLFNDIFIIWGIGYQYSIEFAPILTIGIFSVIANFKSKNLVKFASIIVLIFTLFSTIRTMDKTYLFTNKSKIRIYQLNHYKRNFDVDNIYTQLAKIPSNAIVSCQSPFLPHLALRDEIYQFPIIKDAEYIIYSKKENSYPLNNEDFNKFIEQLKQSKRWCIFYENPDLTILRKANSK